MSEIVAMNTGRRLFLRWLETRESLADLLANGDGDCLYFETDALRIELTVHDSAKDATAVAIELRNILAAALVPPEGEA